MSTPEYRALQRMNENAFEAERLARMDNRITTVVAGLDVAVDHGEERSVLQGLKDDLKSVRNKGIVGFVVVDFEGPGGWPTLDVFFETEAFAEAFLNWYYEDDEHGHDPVTFREYLGRLQKRNKPLASKFVAL